MTSNPPTVSDYAEPVAPAPRSGQPLAGNPNSPPASGDPYADRQPPPIPDFLRRDRA